MWLRHEGLEQAELIFQVVFSGNKQSPKVPPCRPVTQRKSNIRRWDHGFQWIPMVFSCRLATRPMPQTEVSRGLPHPRINGLNAEARQGPGSSSGWGQGLCAASVSARACHEPRRQGSSPTLAKLG